MEYFLTTETLLENNSILKLRSNQSENTCISVLIAYYACMHVFISKTQEFFSSKKCKARQTKTHKKTRKQTNNLPWKSPSKLHTEQLILIEEINEAT